MENRRKYLLIILTVVLVVVVGIIGFYAYQNYKMTEMDKYIAHSNVLYKQLNSSFYEIDSMANKTPVDYNNILNKIDETSNIQKQIISDFEQANIYADGPYKDLIAIGLKKNNLLLNYISYYRSYIEAAKRNDSNAMVQALKNMENTMIEIQKADNEYKTFKSTHLDIKEHGIKYWNSTPD